MKRRRRKLDKGQIVQRKDYAQKAKRYGHTHDFSDTKEDLHVKALEHIMPYIDRYAIESIIDIGSGTARPLLYLQDKRPQLKITGIEPVKEFIDIAEANGFPEGDIIQGYGDRLPFPNDSFDAAGEFGVLHHASHPKRIVSEMMRVSKKAIFMSDTNDALWM